MPTTRACRLIPTAHGSPETGNFIPHLLSPDDAQTVLDLAVSSSQALEVDNAVLHTEIKMSDSGPQLIEVNGRGAGGGIPQLFGALRGVSLIQLAVRIALGRKISIPREAPQGHRGPFRFAYFLQPPLWARRLASVSGMEAVRELEGVEAISVRKSNGEAISPEDGSQGYVLHVGGVAPDLAALSRIPSSVDRTIELAYG